VCEENERKFPKPLHTGRVNIFESYISLGAGWLGSTENSLNRKEQERTFHELLDLGVTHVDTADSYASFDAERMLGKILKTRSGVGITTKVGGYTSPLPAPLNQVLVNSRIYQKYWILRNSGYYDFNPRIHPENLRSRLESSLKRLDVESIDTYLLHGIPGKISLDEYAVEMINLRDRGLVCNIGVSVERVVQSDLSWCDDVLVPWNLVDYFKNSSKKISVHAIFRDTNSSYESKMKMLLAMPNFNRQIIGTKKVARLSALKDQLNSFYKHETN
jgi:aryl-alcohol dehydrogenase-like predicted oxidoreductase